MNIPTPAELGRPSQLDERHASQTDVIADDGSSKKVELPIDSKKPEIISAIASSPAIIVSAETGAGKSTRVPRMLMEAGYEVIVTQPRRLAAMTVADRVADELEQDGLQRDLVGWRTARDREESINNQILFCTDGLQLVRALHSGKNKQKTKKRVLVLDEVHEWNINIEVLVAWAKKQMQQDPDFKVVCMSATLATKELAAFFGAGIPIVNVEGRTYAVEKKVGGYLVDSVIEQAKLGKNILVFLPGKAEIATVESELRNRGIALPIIQLHGELDKIEQKKAFAHHASGKVVLTTNIAQTSITIDDIDVVIDSGIERRKEVRHGVEGLYLGDISKADCAQRAGRAGRTKPGEYFLCSLNRVRVAVGKINERPAFATPEIQRTRLDGTIMKLASAGLDIGQLEFFHQPSVQEITMAKSRLIKLGALDSDGALTQMGKKMERLPVDSHYARMLVEIQKHNNPRLTYMMMEIIAIQQAGGIVKSGKYNLDWQKLTNQTQSDLLAELEVWHSLVDLPKKEWKNYAILSKNVYEARRVLHELKRSIRINYQEDGLPQGLEIELIQKAIVAGLIDQVWVRGRYDRYESVFSGDTRELSKSSVVGPVDLIVAQPFDLQIQGRRGPMTLHLLQDVTALQPSWLTEVAPQLLSLSAHSKTSFDSSTGVLRAEGDLKFGNLIVGSKEMLPTEAQTAEAYLRCLLHSEHIYSRWYKHLKAELDRLSREVRIHDKAYAQELSNRFNEVLTTKLECGLPTSLYSCLAKPPIIEIEDIFTEEDIEKVETIAQQFPAGIDILGTFVPIVYKEDYYTGECTSSIKIELSLASLLLDTPFQAKHPRELAIQLYDAGRYVDTLYNFSALSEYVADYVVAKSEYSIIRANEADELQKDEIAIAKRNPENFGGVIRLGKGSGNVGYWVITAEGRQRPPRSDGTWRVLRDGELAISITYPDGDPMVGEHKIVWHNKPVSSAQLKMIREIEDNLGAQEGVWAVTEEDEHYKHTIVQAVRNSPDLNILLQVLSQDTTLTDNQIFNRLWSETGLCIYDYDPRMEYGGYVSEDDEVADRRDAEAVKIIQVTDKLAVKVLAYYKYGRYNTALKLVNRRVVSKSDTSSVSLNDLEALMNKFNG